MHPNTRSQWGAWRQAMGGLPHFLPNRLNTLGKSEYSELVLLGLRRIDPSLEQPREGTPPHWDSFGVW
jgi:hypothetical protein